MRGPSKTAPKYRKHKATGQAIVTIDGKDFYLGPYDSKASKLEYDRLVGEWLANGRSLKIADKVLTITELIAKYWKHAKGYYVKNGKPTDELPGLKIALQLVRANYGDAAIDQFGPLSLVALQNKFVQRGNCRRYVNQNIGRIKRMFKWGVAQEIVSNEVYQRLTTVSGLRKGKTEASESKPVLPVDESTIEKTILNLRNKVVADMIRIQRLTGCRPGELMIIKPCDVDRDSVDGAWLYYPESHKMEHKERHRVVVIGPKAQAILAKYLLRSENQFCFLRRCGERFERWHYAQTIARACKKAGVETWAPNRLRHAAATEIRKLHGLEAAQVVAGHAQANVTQIYAERDLEKAIRIMQQVG